MLCKYLGTSFLGEIFDRTQLVLFSDVKIQDLKDVDDNDDDNEDCFDDDATHLSRASLS